MRKALGVVLYVVAGFFFYNVSLFSFVADSSAEKKWIIMAVVAVPALLALGGGLALRRFQNWKRDTGVVLLSAFGFTAFVAFSFACLFLTEDFRKLMPPHVLTLFSDYVTGIAVAVVFVGLGAWLVWADRKRA